MRILIDIRPVDDSTCKLLPLTLILPLTTTLTSSACICASIVIKLIQSNNDVHAVFMQHSAWTNRGCAWFMLSFSRNVPQ